MLVRWTDHAWFEANRRGIGVAEVEATLQSPGQILILRPGRAVWQSVLPSGRLLRVFVDIDRIPCEIVTVYCTSKVAKYWRT
jgi:hypothetical protein